MLLVDVKIHLMKNGKICDMKIWNQLKYFDIEGYINQPIITRASNSPGMIVTLNKSVDFVFELTVGFETNIKLITKQKYVKTSKKLFYRSNFYPIKYGDCRHCWNWVQSPAFQ